MLPSHLYFVTFIGIATMEGERMEEGEEGREPEWAEPGRRGLLSSSSSPAPNPLNIIQCIPLWLYYSAW
jgi:hypothetical protein